MGSTRTKPMAATVPEDEFVRNVFRIAREDGYPVHTNRDGRLQINFGHKKLHEGHLRKLYPDVLDPHANVAALTRIMHGDWRV